MKKITVQLPEGDDIEAWQLTTLIAKAIRPSLDKSRGIACVIGKKTYVNEEFGTLRTKGLSESEAEKLDTLLKDLPSIHAAMAEDEQEEFMEKFRAHPDRPNWEPYFATEVDIEKRKYEIQNLQEDHMKVLKDMYAAGKLFAYDLNHRPTKLAGFNVFISRVDAIHYLKSINLFDDVEPSIKLDSEISPQAKGANVTEHYIDENIHCLPKRITWIGRLVLKAATQIYQETGRKASPQETFGRLIEWFKSDSSYAENCIIDFKVETRSLYWRADRFPRGKPFDLKGCAEMLKKWYAKNPNLHQSKLDP